MLLDYTRRSRCEHRVRYHHHEHHFQVSVEIADPGPLQYDPSSGGCFHQHGCLDLVSVVLESLPVCSLPFFSVISIAVGVVVSIGFSSIAFDVDRYHSTLSKVTTIGSGRPR